MTISTQPLTPECDTAILALWGTCSINEISRRTGIGPGRIAKRGREFGLEVLPFRDILAPTDAEWLAMASQAAQEAGVKVSAVVGGRKSKDATAARWKAWKAILEANPRYSVAGLARTSGFDHTAILHGFKRLNGATAKSLRQPSYRASFRRPVDNFPVAENMAQE